MATNNALTVWWILNQNHSKKNITDKVQEPSAQADKTVLESTNEETIEVQETRSEPNTTKETNYAIFGISLMVMLIIGLVVGVCCSRKDDCDGSTWLG